MERSAEKNCIEESTEGKIEPELEELESSSADTGLKHPDSSVSRPGIWNEPLSTTVWLSAGVQIWGIFFFPRRVRYRDANR